MYEKAAPFLKAGGADLGKYAAFRDRLVKMNKNLGSIMPDPSAIKSPEQLNALYERIDNILPEAKAKLAGRLGDTTVSTAKKTFEQVEVPRAELANKYQMGMLKEHIGADLNKMKVSHDYDLETLGKQQSAAVDRYKLMDEKDRFKTVETNYRRTSGELEKERAAMVGKISAAGYTPGTPMYDLAKDDVDQEVNKIMNREIDRYSEMAKASGLKGFTAGKKMPLLPKQYFDARELWMNMPEGSAAEKQKKATMWQHLKQLKAKALAEE
jgi:hypothetical protein